MTRTRPNVLFVMTDQQRFDTIAGLGNPLIHTPNFDRLVRRGMTFTNAYTTCPVCAPSRYGIRTGCEPSRTGVYLNTKERGVNASVRLACVPFVAEILASRGYRTFGVGKFHTWPCDADIGYETHLRSEELYDTPEERRRDAYPGFIASEHPEYDFVEFLMGERSEMYHLPQMSPLPAAVGVEAWAADRACELIRGPDRRPFFGMVSFIGPHPPYAPPIPFNRYYDPDAMRAPVLGDIEEDHRDEQIPWLNYVEFADEISAGLARLLKARYYGEITYIDGCVGRILDALEERPDAEDTLVCFFSDHGDCMGDHHAWEEENFFEASARVPLLVSWPERLTEGRNRSELVCLTDLFGLATSATGEGEMRDGADLLG